MQNQTPKPYLAVSEYAVAKNYSLTMLHIGKVAHLAEMLKISQGEVVRRAIDLLYAQHEQQIEKSSVSNPT